MFLKALHNKSFNVLKSTEAEVKNSIKRNIFDIAVDHKKLRNITILEGSVSSPFDVEGSDETL